MPLGREPSLGELAEDFKEIRTDLKEGITNLTAQLSEMRNEFHKTFLRKDLYEAESKSRDAELRVITTAMREMDQRLSLRTTNIETETIKRFKEIETKATNNWRLGLTALVFPMLMVIFTLIMSQVIK